MLAKVVLFCFLYRKGDVIGCVISAIKVGVRVVLFINTPCV